MKIDQKFRNGLWLFVQEQKTKIIINNSFQEQQAIVFPMVSQLFCNLKIPKQGIKMQYFSCGDS